MLVNVTERGNLTFTHDEREVTHTLFELFLPAFKLVTDANASCFCQSCPSPKHPHLHTHLLSHLSTLSCLPSPVPLLLVLTHPHVF